MRLPWPECPAPLPAGPAAEHCYYRIEEWWTYELCYKKKLRQYHKDSGKVVSQYLLGRYDEGQPQADEVQVGGSPSVGNTGS